MKKISLILIAAMMLALVSCQEAEPAPTSEGPTQGSGSVKVNEELDEVEEAQEGGQILTKVSWLFFDSAESLVKDFDYVVTGKVTGISFRVLDGKTGLPLQENWREYYKEYYGGEFEVWKVAKLFTFYDIEVFTAYKGEPNKTIEVMVMSGLRDYRTEEQLALLKEYGVDIISFCDDYPKLEIGESYLFALDQYEEIPWAVLGNPYQSLFDLRESLETMKRGISARDIISVFGEEEWKAFEAQWGRA